MSQRDNHESYEVFASRLHWIALIMVGSLVVIVWLMWLLSKTWLGPPPRAPIAKGTSVGASITGSTSSGAPTADVPAAPRLQANPPVDLAVLRAREQTELQRYQWIDRQAGVAQIPIERAMALLVQQRETVARREGGGWQREGTARRGDGMDVGQATGPGGEANPGAEALRVGPARAAAHAAGLSK